MLNKVVETFKSTALVWICALIPLLIGVKYMEYALERDSKECVDSFMISEGIGLAKYMSVQFETTLKDFQIITARMRSANISDLDSAKKNLETILKSNKNIISVNIYNKDGEFLASTAGEDNADPIPVQVLNQLKDGIPYTLEQLRNKSIAIKFTVAKNFNAEYRDNDDMVFEFLVKWDHYEKYMLKMQKGSFPRMFYIISPGCNRYVSFNALPKEMVSNQTAAALGVHLAIDINEIPSGLSKKNIETMNFRVFKEEATIPHKMKGNKFFIVIASDIAAVETIASRMLGSIPKIEVLLVIVWLLVCLIIARFYTKTKEQIEITNTISDTTPMAVIVFKAANGRIIKINLVATVLLRIKKEDIKNVNMWDLFIEEDEKNYIVNAISSSINISNYEVLVQTFGGGSFWSLCSASPIVMNNEQYIALAILDINLRKEIEKKLADNAALLEKQIIERTADLELKAKELEESNALLEKSKLVADEANKAKSKFLTNISNELKTPLGAIIGYSEILEEEALDRKDTVSAEDLRKIINSAKHLLALIDEILDLSKIEAGKTQLFFQNFDIVNLIKEVEGVAMPLITKNDNSLFLEYPKDIGTMYSDSTKIKQCLLNLLSNAAKFTEFGKITLRITPLTKSEGSFVEFAVSDTGSGIEESKIDTIFESFQEDATKNSSAGLGLSLTRKYAGYLGGTVSVESTIGCGSKFTIRLPRTCKTTSSEFIEIKNQKDDESFEESDNFQEAH